MKNRLFFFLVVSLLAWPGTSYGQAKAAWQIEWDKTVEGAKREGQVVRHGPRGADAELRDEMNEAWMAWIDKKNLPARAAVGAALTPGTLVEIMVTAAKDK